MTVHYQENRHVFAVTACRVEILSLFIKRVMISHVGDVTNSRLCTFISDAVTLNAVTSSLIREVLMIDQSTAQWSIPGPELALNRSSRHPYGGFMRVLGEKTSSFFCHICFAAFDNGSLLNTMHMNFPF